MVLIVYLKIPLKDNVLFILPSTDMDTIVSRLDVLHTVN